MFLTSHGRWGHCNAQIPFPESTNNMTSPRCGYRNMRGQLHARGHNVQWDRIQDSMRRLCPEEILMWTLQLTAVRCRTYFVQAPLSLWHFDRNHKLIRYLLYVAGYHTLLSVWQTGMIMVSRVIIVHKRFAMQGKFGCFNQELLHIHQRRAKLNRQFGIIFEKLFT